MKLLLNSFFLSLFFVCFPVFGEDYQKDFTVKVSGIKIGKLSWSVSISDEGYYNDLRLKSEGLLSAIYQFEGKYFSEGVFQNKKLKPIRYKHIWITNKVTKNMELVFQDNKIKSLIQTPFEKEKLRINVFNIEQSKDPLTSFLQIILGEKSSLVIDGRRTYIMSSVFNKKTKQNIVEISEYSNLWADHKRKEFEKLIFEKKDGDLFPTKIHIHFDGRVFKLE